MLKLKNAFRRYGTVPCASGLVAVTGAVPAYAADPGAGTTGMEGVLGNVTTLLGWFTKSMTSICTWLIGNELGSIYLGIFIIGAAVAMLFRVLHSA